MAAAILRAVMTRFARHWLSRPLLMGLLLAALTLRALIPTGYMPSVEQPLALELCRVGLPSAAEHPDHADSGADAQSHGGAADSTLCVFGATPGAAPTPDYHTPAVTLAEISTPPALSPAVSLPAQRHRAVQARAPPFSC